MTAHPLALCSIRLRRDGAAPLRFNGWPIARHDGYVARGGVWHDLSLYRNTAGGYVVGIVACCTDVQQVLAFPAHSVKLPHDHAASRAPCQTAQPARCHATLFATLDQALTALENHDATADLAFGAPALALDDTALSLATRVLHAAALQAFCQDVERRYRIGVGAMLAAIGLRTI